MTEPIWKSFLDGLLRRGQHDESKHPRKPKGAPGGGQFAPKGYGVYYHVTKPENADSIEREGLIPGRGLGFNSDAGLRSDQGFIYVSKYPARAEARGAGYVEFAVAISPERLERDYDQLLAGWDDYSPTYRAEVMRRKFPRARWKPYAQWGRSDVVRAIDELSDAEYEKMFNGNYRVQNGVDKSNVRRTH